MGRRWLLASCRPRTYRLMALSEAYGGVNSFVLIGVIGE